MSDDKSQSETQQPANQESVGEAKLHYAGLPPDDEKTVISTTPVTREVDRFVAGELGQTLVGRRLEHFELTEFVGGGGMGAVFRATDTLLNRTVAVKVLSRDQGRDEETVKRFKNEAQSAARLDHENIARVYFVGEDDGWYFIVFEFIDGDNLRDLVEQRGPLPLEEALSITLQIAEALEHASRRDVVHRDIKPSNVLLTRAGRAKLVDMGLARLDPMGSTGELTASGVTLGTFDYISPEQARDPRTADVRSDIYSLGCTLFFMLTARPPFPEGTVLQKLLSHSSELPPDPRQFRPELPEDVTHVVSKMLAKKPTDRYQRSSDLIGDLLLLAERLGLQAAMHGEPIWIAADKQRFNVLERHLPWIVPIVVLMSFVFLVEPIWLEGDTPDIQVEYRKPQPSGADSPDVRASKSTPDATGPTESTRLPSRQIGTGTNGGNGSPSDRVASQSSESATESGRDARTRVDGTDEVANPDSANGVSTDEALMSDRTIIVDPAADASLVLTSGLVARDLDEACQMAIEDTRIERIEIRENGRIRLSPLTLSLYERNLHIYAAEGYSPVLSFRTANSVSDNNSQGMIRILNGQLSFGGLHFELIVPNDSLEGEWSLFQAEQIRSLRMQHCTVTVRNSYGGRFSNLDNVSVVHIVPDELDEMLEPDMDSERPPTEIDLQHCVIRGETNVLRVNEAVPVALTWYNGLLVTTERLVRLNGAREMPNRDNEMSIELGHVTAIVDEGLAEFVSNSKLPFLMDMRIQCNDCILVSQRWSPMVVQTGPQRLSSLLAQMAYVGGRNFYDGIETFWQVVPRDRSQTEIFDFEMWRNHWTSDVTPTQGRVKWQNPPDKNRPTHEHRVVQYTLSLNDNPAIKSSADRRSNAGFMHGLLPRLPEPD